MNENTLSIAAKIPVTGAEGPGNRFAIWVQGCPFRCPGCCNPHYLSFSSDTAEQISPRGLSTEILEYKDEIEGVTFIGGEPFSQAKALAELAEIIRQHGMSIMVFSGFTLAQLSNSKAPEFENRKALLAQTDLLVDGLYLREQHVSDRRWIGSANQEIHFLTDRYLHLKDNWPAESNTIEIRYKNGEITINGFPHPEITRENLRSIRK